jgi:ERCC4-related helicase
MHAYVYLTVVGEKGRDVRPFGGHAPVETIHINMPPPTKKADKRMRLFVHAVNIHVTHVRDALFVKTQVSEHAAITVQYSIRHAIKKRKKRTHTKGCLSPILMTINIRRQS